MQPRAARTSRFIPTVLAAFALVLPVAGGDPRPEAEAPEAPPAAWTIIAPRAAARLLALEENTAFLGVHLREETERPGGGARVTEVVPDSPAEAAGIEEGDVIVGFAGDVIRGPLALTEHVHEHDPGDRVEIRFLRGEAARNVEVELGRRKGPPLPGRGSAGEDAAAENHRRALAWHEDFDRLGRIRSIAPRPFGGPDERPRLGVQLVEATPELREHLGGGPDAGVLVSKVLGGTPAEHAGIAVGDLIVGVDGRRVADSSELVEALADLDGATFEVEVVRAGRSQSIRVTLPKREKEPRTTGPRALRAPLSDEPRAPLSPPRPPPPPPRPASSPAGVAAAP